MRRGERKERNGRDGRVGGGEAADDGTRTTVECTVAYLAEHAGAGSADMLWCVAMALPRRGSAKTHTRPSPRAVQALTWSALYPFSFEA